MKRIAFFLVLIIAWYGCKKNDNETSKFNIGTFQGEKTIYYPSTHYESADTITIQFDSTTYSYSSSNALDFGRGNYLIKNNSVEFKDEEFRIALYTWDWILSGTFNLQITDGLIILNQNNLGNQISCRLKRISK